MADRAYITAKVFKWGPRISKNLDAFRGGYIEPTQASSLLNVKVNKFPKLEVQMHK